MTKHLVTRFLVAATLVLVARPGQAQTAPALVPVPATELPQLVPDGDLIGLRQALQLELGACAQLDPDETRPFGTRIASRREWCTETLGKMLDLVRQAPDFASLQRGLREQFEWFKSVGSDGQGKVLFTGYNFPELEGTAEPDAFHRFPFYAKPDELVQVDQQGKKVWRRKLPDGSFVPGWTRKEIDLDGALQGRGLELAWVGDPFDAFFFHIEGAGAIRIRRPDGTVERRILNYAGSNGHPYLSLRKILIEEGVPQEEWTVQGMKRWFNQHPERLMPALTKNPSYVFFVRAEEGPLGTTGTVLTPGHSIAIDPEVFPLGALAFFQTEKPVMPADGTSNATQWQPFSRLAVAQDTGGAIKGAGHIDLYWGSGPEADYCAGQMKREGPLFFALPLKKK